MVTDQESGSLLIKLNVASALRRLQYLPDLDLAWNCCSRLSGTARTVLRFSSSQVGDTMTTEAKASAGWLDGASRGAVIALGIAVVVAVIGVAEAYKGREDLAAMRAELAKVGLDASTADSLNAAIAAKKRELNRAESALVSFSAAAEARQEQAVSAAALADRKQAEAAEAMAAQAEASRIFADLDPKNRTLQRAVRDYENRLVAATAAVNHREGQLQSLITEVEENSVLVAAATQWRNESDRLLAEKDALERHINGLENEIVALAAATEFRKKEVAQALVDKSNAENEHRLALKEALELRAESRNLVATIDGLKQDRKVADRAYMDANNRLVPMIAAAARREAQVQELAAKVQTLETSVAGLSNRHQQLTTELAAADDRLGELSKAAQTAAQHLAAIDQLLGAPTVQAALTEK